MPPAHPEETEDVTPQSEAVQRLPGELKQESLRQGQTAQRSGENVPGFTPSSYKERAGVSLTWGVLALIALFLGTALVYLWTFSPPACKTLEALETPLGQALAEGKSLPETIITVFQQCESQRNAFYDFWLEMVQRIFLNALLPVLTALLGYLFGTQHSTARQEEAQR